MLLMQLDLPAPVWPAISTCGNVDEVRHHRVAGDVAPHRDLEWMLRLLRLRAREDVAERDDRAHLVGNLDADRAAAGDRRQDADVVARHRVRDLLGEAGDLVDLHAGRELELVAGDGRADGRAEEAGVDAELAHGRLEDLAAFLHELRVDLARLAALQDRCGGQLPAARTVAGRQVDRQLFGGGRFRLLGFRRDRFVFFLRVAVLRFVVVLLVLVLGFFVVLVAVFVLAGLVLVAVFVFLVVVLVVLVFGSFVELGDERVVGVGLGLVLPDAQVDVGRRLVTGGREVLGPARLHGHERARLAADEARADVEPVPHLAQAGADDEQQAEQPDRDQHDHRARRPEAGAQRRAGGRTDRAARVLQRRAGSSGGRRDRRRAARRSTGR